MPVPIHRPALRPHAGRTLAALLGLAGAACSTPLADPGGADLAVDLEDTHQTVEGFGASLAWYQGALLAHPLADELTEHAFAGLGLDILRFRNRYARSEEPADVAEEAAITERATESLGHPPRILLSSWSPPAALKAGGREGCNGNVAACTLIDDGDGFAYGRFAAYWVESLAFYREAGIDPEWISIQNEPDFTPNGWEGCRFEPAETAQLPGYAEALAAVAGALAEAGDAVGLLGPEPQGVHYDKIPNYLAPLDADLLDGVAYHLYEQGGDGVWDWRSPGPDSYVSAMRGAAAAARGLPIFQTEFQTDEDEFVDGGFETAWLIQNALVDGGVSAFLYWDLVWPNSGLIALEGEGDYVLRDQYYALRHFALHTDPGDVRVGTRTSVPGLRASAFLAPDGERLTLVLLNVGDEALSITLDLGALTGRGGDVFQTEFDPGQSRLWSELGELGEALDLPTRSVTTVVVR